MPIEPGTARRLIRWGIILVVLGGAVGAFAWYKFFRQEPEPPFATADDRFKYGSVGGEADAGIPYWIWVVLPRVFPEYVPRAGGYEAFGLVWEAGHELPVGFTKRTIGFPRVGNNCALCHVGTYRTKLDQVPTVVVGAPAHSLRIQELLRFLVRSARDPRFAAGPLLEQIERETELSIVDRLLYRFVIIPATRSALREQGSKLEWMDGRPDWGAGRDDAFNLPKFVLVGMADDGSTGQCDFASVWNMRLRTGPGRWLNWSGETPAMKSVVIDSALGVGARPGSEFDAHAEWIEGFMNGLEPGKYPFAIDPALADAGRAVYQQNCGECHEPGAKRTNTVIGLDEIGTDPAREQTWSQGAADQFNALVEEMGFDRPPWSRTTGT